MPLTWNQMYIYTLQGKERWGKKQKKKKQKQNRTRFSFHLDRDMIQKHVALQRDPLSLILFRIQTSENLSEKSPPWLLSQLSLTHVLLR